MPEDVDLERETDREPGRAAAPLPRRYDFDTPIDRRGTDSIKWDPETRRAICGVPDALPLWVADMDFAVPPAVTNALQARIAHPILGYPTSPDTLVEAFRSWTETRHRLPLTPNEIVPVPGLLAGVSAAVRCLTRPGDRIIIQTPIYRPFRDIISGLGRRVESNPLLIDDTTLQAALDIESFSRLAANPDVTMVILCSPHNPTGRVWTEDELTELFSICARQGVTIVSDEIHADLCHVTGNHHPAQVIAQRVGAVCITCMAPSKTFNIPGEHVGFAIITEPSVRQRYIDELKASCISHLSVLGTTAATAAYQEGKDWLDELVCYLQENLRTIRRSLEDAGPCGIRLMEPEASFYALLDCRGLAERFGLHGRGALVRFVAHRAGVALMDGAWFGSETEGWLRINFASPHSQIVASIQALTRLWHEAQVQKIP